MQLVMLQRLLAWLTVVLVASACTGSTTPGPPHPHILNVWLIGGQSSVMFCPHPELMIGPISCQPLSLIAAAVPRVLPSPGLSANQPCKPQYQVIFNFADRSRISYGCPLPAPIRQLVNVIDSVLPRPTPTSQAVS